MEFDNRNLDMFEHLLATRSYNELTNEERQFVLGHVESGDEYERLRGVSEFTACRSEVSPEKRVIQNLQRHLFNKHRKSGSPSLFELRVPAYYLGIVIVIFLILFFQNTKVDKPTPAAVILRTDTIYLSSNPDTVFVERVVYKNLPSSPKSTPIQVVHSFETKNAMHDEGVSMKEKEELESLLVSGS